MKTQLERLNALEINLDLFYVVSFKNYEIRLQGIATPETISECKKLVHLEFNNEMEWLFGTRDNITITLTL